MVEKESNASVWCCQYWINSISWICWTNLFFYAVICKKYGIGRSTVSDIRKSRDKLTKFHSDMVSMGMSRDAKVIKQGDDQQQLISDNGVMSTKFLPPNVTSLIQPMDQGVLQTLKKRYKQKLLRRLIIEDGMGGTVVNFLKDQYEGGG